jgi:hypothetical protein
LLLSPQIAAAALAPAPALPAECRAPALRQKKGPHLVLGRVRAVNALVRHARALGGVERLGQLVAGQRQQLVQRRRGAA